MAVELGADAVLLSPQQSTSSSITGGATMRADEHDKILEFYKRIATVSPSIVLQDYPASNGVYYPLSLLTRIVTEVPQVQCIKLESMPTITRLAALRENADFKQSGCTILTGLGGLYAGFEVEQGIVSGFMTGFAFPEVLKAMNDYAQMGNYDRCHVVYNRFLPLFVLEHIGGLALRKEIYRMRGLIETAYVRDPGNQLSPILRSCLEIQIARSFAGVDIRKPLTEEVLLSV
jgi:4-hydroxy-tetrahydrodipicolinate synthase